MDVGHKYTPPVKLNNFIDEDNANDVYCFECHYEGDLIRCDLCPRVYHLKCLNLTVFSQGHWICPECEVTQSPFHTINQRYSMNDLHIMLKHALHRLKSHPQAEYFLKSIDLNANPGYYDYIIHPMDLQIIGKNLHLKKYNSTEVFLSDIKWMVHNSFIYYGNQSKLTHIARTLLKKARHEMSEIEICPECYSRTAQPVTTDWFTKPCTIPHVLCWAKMKTYQSWPAKVLRIVNEEVDVRFFGKHDRAWVSYNDCFVLSKEYPGTEKQKANRTFDDSLVELQIHINQLKKLYGHFTYAPPQTLLSRTKPFKFVSIIDDSNLPSYMTAANNSFTFRSRRRQSSTIKATDKRSNERMYTRSTKRFRISSDRTDEESQSTLNVFDILNQSDSSIFHDHQIRANPSRYRCASPTDSKYLIQGLLRQYTDYQPSAIEPIHPDVRLAMDALLDAVEVRVNISKQSTRKKSRKSNLRHRIIPENTSSNLLTCTSLDQLLSPTSLYVPLRPLSVSPPSIDSFQAAPSEIHDDVIPRRYDKFDEELPISISPFLSLPSSIDRTIPSIIPCLSPIPLEQNIQPSVLFIDSPKKQSRSSSDLSRTRVNNNDHQIQSIVTHFNNQFQHLLVDFTSQINSSLRATRMKYEKDREEIHRSYRQSLNDLHTIATEQVQEIHNSLELQYWKRLSDMRHRYESKLHYFD